jgi:hypothetical protein
MISRWVLIAGTGKSIGLSNIEEKLAEELGCLLAERGYGLVVGGWPGVDYVAASAYANAVKLKKLSLADSLIQVVADCRPAIFPDGADYPDFKGGYVITVLQGVREWIEAIKYADAVILLGGEGGTLEMYHYALQEQRPVFPIFATGGDAATSFNDAVNHWEALPYHGIDKVEFIETLLSPVNDLQQTAIITHNIIDLLAKRFDCEDKGLPESMPIFISYAHEDYLWLNKVRSAPRPLGKASISPIWDDTTLKASDVFEAEIKQAINNARVAVLLVSDNFLESEFILYKELPWLLARQKTGHLRIFWIHIQGERWRTTDLAQIITATGDVDTPLSMFSSTEQQDAMVKVRNAIAKALVKKDINQGIIR